MSYQFVFPDGGNLKFTTNNLTSNHIETLIEQFDRPIRALIPLGQQDNIPIPFNATNKRFERPVIPGRYRIELQEDIEEFFTFCLCGSYLHWLQTGENACQKGREIFPGTVQRYYIQTSANAVVKSSMCVVSDRLVITLDYESKFQKDFLQLKPLSKLINPDSTYFGSISGKLSFMASLLPYSLYCKIIQLSSIMDVVFTGSGWSGSVAHVAAMTLRNYLKSMESEVTVKAISFSGPLCASSDLLLKLSETQQIENHVTINCGGNILDRLIGNYQRLSPLSKVDIASWSQIYSIFYGELDRFQKSPNYNCNLSAITEKEEILTNHSTLLSDAENKLHPIGQYFLKGSGDAEVINQDKSVTIFTLLVNCVPLSWMSVYGLNFVPRDTINEVIANSSRGKIELDLKPVLQKISIVITAHILTITLEGQNLDALIGRHIGDDVPLTAEEAPFRCMGFSFLVDDARLISLQTFGDRVTIKMSGVRAPQSGAMKVMTDFGESNERLFTSNDVVRGEEQTPSRALHPTMNAKFLSSAFLRVALSCPRFTPLSSLKIVDKQMHRLWIILVDLERLLCPTQHNSLLVADLDEYLKGEKDISQIRHECLHHFEEMSRAATEDINFKENPILRGLRKLFGAFGYIIGGIFRLAGGLLFLPSLLLLVPLLSTGNVPYEDGSSYAANTYANAVSLPAMLADGLGKFLQSAAARVMEDRPSIMYKNILYDLIRVMGGDPMQIVDELEPLEDMVVTLFSKFFCGCDLHSCRPEDIAALVQPKVQSSESSETDHGAEIIHKLNHLLRDIPVLITKLCVVGRIHEMRKILQRQYVIGFIGVHNAGKSTTISKLFDIETGADLIKRTEVPKLYSVGGWLDTVAMRCEEFNEWRSHSDRNDLKIYAIDFPGTDDERVVVGSITEDTAEVASIFVVVLKVGHIAGPEKAVVDIAKNQSKPFIVLINQCETLHPTVLNGDGLYRLKKNYATTLKVPDNLIYFGSAVATTGLFAGSLNVIRRYIVSLIQCLICDSNVCDAISLRFIPPRVIDEIRDSENEEVYSKPEALSRAAASLICKASYITGKNLLELTKFLHIPHQFRSSDVGLNLFHVSSPFCCIDQLRQIAAALKISIVPYLAFIDLYNEHYVKLFASFTQFRPHMSFNKNAVDSNLGYTVISSLRSQLNQYYDIEAESSPPFISVGVEVLFGLQALFQHWQQIFLRDSDVLRGAMVKVLRNGEPSTWGSNILQTVEFLTSDDGVNIHVPRESSVEKMINILSVSGPGSISPEGDEERESVRFIGCCALWDSLLRDVKIQPFRKFARLSNQLNFEDHELMRVFFRDLANYTQSKKIAPMVLRSRNIVEEILTSLLVLTNDEILLNFEITTQNSLTTPDALLEIASQINTNPNGIMLMRSESGYLYFDPSYCASPCQEIREKAKNYYLALGRLIGFALMKGLPFPIDFPINVFRLLLGYRLGVADLQLIHPTLVRSLASLDDESLKQHSIFFDEIGHEYSGPSANGQIIVNEHNRMRFVTHVVKYFLCCQDGDEQNPVHQLIVGIQNILPRQLFVNMSPVLLQFLLEAPVNTIDIEPWKRSLHFLIRNESDRITEALFYSAIDKMDCYDKARLYAWVHGSLRGLSEFFQYQSRTIVNVIEGNSDPVSLPMYRVIILPRCQSLEEMKNKLRTVIRGADGEYMSSYIES